MHASVSDTKQHGAYSSCVTARGRSPVVVPMRCQTHPSGVQISQLRSFTDSTLTASTPHVLFFKELDFADHRELQRVREDQSGTSLFTKPRWTFVLIR